MALDIAQIRAATPGIQAGLTHLNNSGAGLMPSAVLDRLQRHLHEEATLGGYEANDAHLEELEGFYQSAATMIGASPNEIAFIENATRAWDMAFYALPFAKGDRILTSVAEYGSNFIAYLHVAKRTGAVVEVVPDDEDGQIDVAALERMVAAGGAALISVTHMPTNGGLINPAAEVGRVAKAHGVPFLLDACQTVGQMPIDVEAIGCDMLSATGRKYLRGPRGTGFLYVRASLLDRLDPPLLDHHAATWVSQSEYTVRDDARRFENWESYVAGRLGLKAAIDYWQSLGQEACWARVQALAARARAGLEAIPGTVLRDKGVAKGGIVSFTPPTENPMALKQRLAAQGINISTSRTGSTRLDMEGRGLDIISRIGVHYYNDEAEVDRFLEAVAAAR